MWCIGSVNVKRLPKMTMTTHPSEKEINKTITTTTIITTDILVVLPFSIRRSYHNRVSLTLIRGTIKSLICLDNMKPDSQILIDGSTNDFHVIEPYFLCNSIKPLTSPGTPIVRGLF